MPAHPSRCVSVFRSELTQNGPYSYRWGNATHHNLWSCSGSFSWTVSFLNHSPIWISGLSATPKSSTPCLKCAWPECRVFPCLWSCHGNYLSFIWSVDSPDRRSRSLAAKVLYLLAIFTLQASISRPLIFSFSTITSGIAFQRPVATTLDFDSIMGPDPTNLVLADKTLGPALLFRLFKDGSGEVGSARMELRWMPVLTYTVIPGNKCLMSGLVATFRAIASTNLFLYL